MNDLSPGTAHRAPALAEALVDTNFPIFWTQHGPALWPAFNPAAGVPVIVLSVPKSGTYFTEALYRRMGYRAVFVHAMDGVCNDWRFRGAERDDTEMAGLKRVPITVLAQLLLPGQIIVSHCSRSPETEAALRGFKKVYLYRNLREVLISHARASSDEEIPAGQLATHVARFCRDRGRDLKAVILAAAGWRNQPDVLAVDFADLTTDEPDRRRRVAQRFAAFMDWPADDVVPALAAVPGDETPTKSEGGRSTVADGWDAACEAWFREHMEDVRLAPDATVAAP
jgi:hypothetical protein